MTRAQPRRRFRRLLIPLTLGIIIVDFALWATEIVSAMGAVLLFVAIELPLAFIVIALLVRRYARERRSGLSRWMAVERMGETEPPIRLVISELATLNSLWLLIRRKRAGVDEKTTGLAYAKGTLGLPLAFLVAAVIEIIVLHLVLPWAWLRLVVLIITVYSIILILGYLAARVVHPHLLNNEYLLLRSGKHVITRIPRRHIATVTVRNRYGHTYPIEEDGHLHLASNPGTNVDLMLKEPVQATLPGLLAKQRRSFDTREISLYLEHPDMLATSIARKDAEPNS